MRGVQERRNDVAVQRADQGRNRSYPAKPVQSLKRFTCALSSELSLELRPIDTRLSGLSEQSQPRKRPPHRFPIGLLLSRQAGCPVTARARNRPSIQTLARLSAVATIGSSPHKGSQLLLRCERLEASRNSFVNALSPVCKPPDEGGLVRMEEDCYTVGAPNRDAG